jgi:hypothetical protein
MLLGWFGAGAIVLEVGVGTKSIPDGCNRLDAASEYFIAQEDATKRASADSVARGTAFTVASAAPLPAT